MGRELSHAEAEELLGVYALDALDDDERQAVDRHLGGCRLCQLEVIEHREVAAVLTAGIDRPPEGLWERISESLEDVPPPLAFPVRPPPIAVAAAPPRRSAAVRVAAMVAAVAAVTVIGVLGLKVADDGRRIDSIAAGSQGEELQRTIDAAMADKTAVRVSLESTDGSMFADAVVLPDGRGYLVKDNLPTLAPDRGYQLWALVGTEPISIGLLGPEPQPSAFRATGPVRGFAITNEPAVGVSSPSQAPVVSGLVHAS